MYPTIQNIFLLQTGGTIGSAIHDGCIDVDPEKGDVLIQTYLKSASRLVDFEVSRPFTILSENLVPAHWSQIIDALKTVDFDRYKGIIVTHGSDTLPYTAAALSYFFSTTPIPIVLVCSNHPLGHPESNALPNFSGAVDFILNTGLPGIFTVYENKDGKTQIHLGTRLLEADWINDNFLSFGGRPFAVNDRHCLSHGNARLSPSIDALKDRAHHTSWAATPVFTERCWPCALTRVWTTAISIWAPRRRPRFSTPSTTQPLAMLRALTALLWRISSPAIRRSTTI